jgi:achaete-scute complex protein
MDHHVISIADSNPHAVSPESEICDPNFFHHEQQHHPQQQVVPGAVHHPQEYAYHEQDASAGDYIILSNISDQRHDASQTEKQQEPIGQNQPSYNILDQSVRELFYDEPAHDEEQQEHNGNDFQVISGHPDDEDTSDSFSTTYGSQNGFSNTHNSDSENSSKSGKVNPFSQECLIPLPGGFEGGFMGRTFVRKRNERERARVRSVNDGFERLRAHLPIQNEPKDRRLSKVETLRYAINYIEHLQSLLNDE